MKSRTNPSLLKIIRLSHIIALFLINQLVPHLLPTICAQNTPNPADDWTTAGPFNIAYCNAANYGPSQSSYLRALLPQFQDALNGLLQDLALGNASQHGYSAFFKSDSSLNPTQKIFGDMANGSKVLTGVWDANTGRFTEPPRWEAPTFVCLNAGEKDTEGAYGMCQTAASASIAATSSGHQLHNVAGVAKNSGIVYLCPTFFHLPRVSRRASCPLVDSETNQFYGDGLSLTTNQYAILVHELFHVYNKGNARISEVYEIQETVDLSEQASQVNAQNYAFYAACESYLISSRTS